MNWRIIVLWLLGAVCVWLNFPCHGVCLSGSISGAGGIGGLLARTDTNGSTYYHGDGNGNITALMDGNENIIARYLYNPYGKLLGQWGTMANANTMQFSSMPQRRSISLFAFRGYEPNFQRWLNRDPIGENGGINLYRFVGNDPVIIIDPSGLAQGYGNDVYGANGEAAGPSSYYEPSTSAPNGQFYNGNTYSVGPGPQGYDVATPQYGPDLDALNNLPLPGFPNFNPGIDAGGITDLSGDALGLYLAGAGAADLLDAGLGAIKPNPPGSCPKPLVGPDAARAAMGKGPNAVPGAPLTDAMKAALNDNLAAAQNNLKLAQQGLNRAGNPIDPQAQEKAVNSAQARINEINNILQTGVQAPKN